MVRRLIGYSLSALLSIALIVASWLKLVPMSETEVFGFLTGAASVWLTVKVNIWNWPIGIANNLFFAVLFFDARLYADMALQVVYLVLEVLGWYWWLHGGDKRSKLPIARTPFFTAAVLGMLLILGTFGETLFLRSINDSVPFLDAFTTALSLVAQFMLTKKFIENWYVWITADVIYIGLYLYKNLYLTSILYLLFLIMCVVGVRYWQREMRAESQPAVAALAGEASNG